MNYTNGVKYSGEVLENGVKYGLGTIFYSDNRGNGIFRENFDGLGKSCMN